MAQSQGPLTLEPVGFSGSPVRRFESSFRVVRHVWHGLQALEAYFIYWPGIFGPLSLISFRPKGVLLIFSTFLYLAIIFPFSLLGLY